MPPSASARRDPHNAGLTKSLPTVERALSDLERLIRRPSSDSATPHAVSAPIPEDLVSGDGKALALSSDEFQALAKARQLLAEDLRFEHLREDAANDATWRFVCVSHLQPKSDLVPEFVKQHARAPMQRTCFFPVELLAVTEEVELFGVRFLPLDAAQPPALPFIPDPTATMKSIVGVACSGTSYDKMSKRARTDAERALRLLRATLREDRWLPNPQLRFRLGQTVWFDDGAGGWTAAPDEGWDLTIDDKLVGYATSQALSTLPAVPTNDIERRVHLALRWFERAQLAADPLDELLYLFFALEAILGEKSAGLKAPALAIRRAILGLLTRDGFTHPARTYLLYDKVRSAAVHGEEPPNLSPDEVGRFAWDVRHALNEFLEYSRAEGYTKRVQVRKALDRHERRQGVIEALLEQNPKLWRRYLEHAGASQGG
jgi:hypothetical protein